MNAEFKKLKAQAVTAFADEIQKIRGVIPEEFAEAWVLKRWTKFEGYARGAVTNSVANALREFARSKCTEALCLQLHLPGEYFENLPVAVPTENDGYAGAGLAIVSDWERSIAEHDRQIEGHEASKARIRAHIETRRSLGIMDNHSWYEKHR